MDVGKVLSRDEKRGMSGWFPMPLPRGLSPGHLKIRKIKMALGNRCELCGRERPLESIEIHAIQGDRLVARDILDLEREILVLCAPCHRDVHEASLTVAEQKEILRYRPGHLRKEIRRILTYTPRPYVPPDSNISEIYEEAIRVNTHIFGV
jgi:hypothetical protein